MRDTLRTFGKCVGQCAKLMIGVPDYDTYAAHMRANHPGKEPMSYEAFFRERQASRYGDGGSRTLRCC